MKRFFSLFFVCLLALSFFGCSKEDDTSTSENTSTPTETRSKVTTTTEESLEITSESTTEETTEGETTIAFVTTTTTPTTIRPTTTKPTTTKPTTTKPTTTKPTTTKPTQAPTQPPVKTPKLPATPFTVNLEYYGDSATVTITKIELVPSSVNNYEMTVYARLDASTSSISTFVLQFDSFDSDNVKVSNAMEGFFLFSSPEVGMTIKATSHIPTDATTIVFNSKASYII